MKESFSRLRQIEHHNNDQVRIYNNMQPDDYPAHWNNAFEIIVPIKEDYTVVINETYYDVRVGEVIIIPAGSVHELFAPPSGRRYIIMAETSIFYTVDGLAAAQHCFYPCVHLRHNVHDELLDSVHDCIAAMVREYESGDYFSHAAVRLWLSTMFIRIARELMRIQDEADSTSTNRHQQSMAVFLDVCTYITNHCSQKLTLESVASYSGYSKYHFARMFKAYSGMSFYDFFLRQRVLLCKQLLSDSSISVTEVALRSGFGSIATFNRIFKQYEKMTPSEYRKLHQALAGHMDPTGEEDSNI